MNGGAEKGRSQRERLELTMASLAPAALGLVTVPVAAAGRLAWLAPVLALPVGLVLCRLWRALGAESLPRGLNASFGRWLGKGIVGGYLLWGIFLLAVSARRYADRLTATVGEGGSRWLFLAATLVVTLWLSRGDGASFARTGRIFFLAVTAVMGAVLLLALSSLRWQNLWPARGEDASGLPAAALAVLSLAGYGVYALCLPLRKESGLRGGAWTVWASAALAVLLLAVVGAFGPALVGEMDEPILYLLRGVGLPGAFQRGEAALAAVIALGDLALLALLEWSCGALGQMLIPKWTWGRYPAALFGFLIAGWLPDRGSVLFLSEEAAPVGNLFFGVLLPALAVLTEKIRNRGKGQAISCGENNE